MSDIAKRLDEIEERLKKLEEKIQKKPVVEVDKKLSIREFFLTKHPKDEIQKTLLVAYYLEKYEGMDFFNAKDIEEGFRSAKEKAPDNINYKVYMNIKKGYLMDAVEKKNNMKACELTNTGVSIIKNDFKDD